MDHLLVSKVVVRVLVAVVDAVEVGVVVAEVVAEEVCQVLAVSIKQRRNGHSRTNIKRVERTITEREDMTKKWLEACYHHRENPVGSLSRTGIKEWMDG